MNFEELKKEDNEILKLIENEKERQMEGIELIPSENLVSKAVLEAMASYPQNKYSEGYSSKRYYGGNEVIDKIEDLAIARAKKLFNAEHVNVQPLSGSPANFMVYFSIMEHGDKALGLELSHGGHLTHGHKVNLSGKLFDFKQYPVDEKTEMLDYETIRKIAKKEKPKLILSGYTAYPRKIDFKQFREIADEVGAFCMADISHIAGLIAGKQHENSVPYFDAVTTTTHKTLRGPRGAIIMCKEEYAQAIDKTVFPGMQGGPHEHIIAAKAVAFKEAQKPEFEQYAKQIVKNSKALAEALQEKGFRLVSNGTDTHLILIDLTNKETTGKEAELALEKAGIYCNKNTIPYDKRSPFNPSGIRIGTPTITTRGMKQSEMKEIAEFINQTIKNKNNETKLKEIKEQVKTFCQEYAFY